MPDMDQDEARGRFADARIARLATIDPGGRPHLVPVVFACRGDRVVTAVDWKPKRSQQVRRLQNIAVNPAVSLLVDAYDEEWDRLWWVRADGGARTVPPDVSDGQSREEYAEAIALLRQKYAQYLRRPPEGPVIVITVVAWTGWRAVREEQGGA